MRGGNQHVALVLGQQRMIPEPSPEGRLPHQTRAVPSGPREPVRQEQVGRHLMHLPKQCAQRLMPLHLLGQRDGMRHRRLPNGWPGTHATTEAQRPEVSCTSGSTPEKGAATGKPCSASAAHHHSSDRIATSV